MTPKIRWKDAPDGRVADGRDSYIQQSSVITRVGDKRKAAHDEWKEYYLFEGAWQFAIIEMLDGDGKVLPTTVSILPRNADGTVREVDLSRVDRSKQDKPPQSGATIPADR